jgi:hypothetical protein
MLQKKFTACLNIKTSSLPDKDPLYIIKNNGRVCNDQFDADFGDNQLEIEFLNKMPTDSQVDENGNIIADLNVEVQGLIVDGVDLTVQFKNNCVYVINDGGIEKTYGFLHKNGKVTFEFVCPPFLYLRNLALVTDL